MTINEDYQVIDAHIDETMWKKILSFEYIDFGKLVVKNKPYREEEHQHLEIVNKNSYSFLSPVSDREMHQINNYAKWEQAFRVYSNVITTQYPNKATELLQYNHTIHTAVTSYSWENIYLYDREFRQHIGRHPQRPWNVILQQAWTMLLKDRLKYDNMAFQRGGTRSSKKDKEPCRRLNRGKCTFGLSCKFDHHCSVKKCGKFGHGAHICRLRNTEATTASRAVQDTQSPVKEEGIESTPTQEF